ncbi:unnamed protein product [Camellia sinensis]
MKPGEDGPLLLNKPPVMADSSSWYAKLSRAIVGWFCYNVVFHKAVVFMAALLFSHSLVDRGVVGILISYLEENWEGKSCESCISNERPRRVISGYDDCHSPHFRYMDRSFYDGILVIKCKSQTKKVKPTRSPITNVYYVTKAAIWKRNLDYTATSKQFYHNDNGELELSPPVALLSR